jgi:hypothetical protein
MGDVTRPAATALGAAQTLKRGGQSCPPRINDAATPALATFARQVRRPAAQAFVIALLAAFLAAAGAPVAYAVTEFHWIGAGTGGQTGTDPADQTTRWNNNANWQEGMRPGSTEGAMLAFNNAGYANVRSTISVSGLIVDGPSADGALHIMDGADLSTAQNYGIIVGNGAQGKVVQTGGSVTVNGILRIGSGPHGSGTYLLQGGTVTVPASCDEYIGEFGTGVFTQTGGTHIVESALYVGEGYSMPGTGILNMEGGTLRVGTFFLAQASSSGTLNVKEPLAVIEAENITLGPKSVITCVPGGTIHILCGSYPGLYNKSTDEKALEGLQNLALVFDGDTQGWIGAYEVSGADLGATYTGFVDNFALGTLVVGCTNSARVALIDRVDNGNRSSAEALYVHNLTISPGSRLDLGGINLFYDGSLVNQGTIIGGRPIFVPEPATLALLVMGTCELWRRNRTARWRKNQHRRFSVSKDNKTA